jgi:nitric oxide reductase subunit C
MKISNLRFYLVIALFLPGFFFANLSIGKDVSTGRIIVIPPDKYSPLPQTSESRKGHKEFELNHCASCHSIDSKGGCLAPPLDGIGARRNKTFILARITDDNWARGEFAKLYPHPELLEHPRFSTQKAKEIAAYLLTIPEPKHGYLVTGHSAVANGQTPDASPEAKSKKTKAGDDTQSTSQSIASGKALFDEHGCIACHSIGGLGGHLAPAFDGINQRHDRRYIADQMTAAEFMTRNYPDEYQGRGNVMPPSNLTDEQIQQITTFLMSLPKD